VKLGSRIGSGSWDTRCVSLNHLLALILALVGVPLALGASRGLARTYRQFPLFNRRPIGRLIPRRKCVVEGFARAEPVVRAPLTGMLCIAWEARGFIEQKVKTQHGTQTAWVAAGVPFAEAMAFALEDEEARASVHVPACDGLTFGGFGDADTEHVYREEQFTELHREIGLPTSSRTMIKMWVLNRLDQCTVVGIAGLLSDGASTLQGLPELGKRVVIIPGSASAATGKVLIPALGWTLLLLLGLSCLAGATAMLIA
jgi:hypothetical protein